MDAVVGWMLRSHLTLMYASSCFGYHILMSSGMDAVKSPNRMLSLWLPILLSKGMDDVKSPNPNVCCMLALVLGITF